MLKDEYVSASGGQVKVAATIFARDLMRGDPASFKAGYSLDNAIIAATEVFDLSKDEADEIRAKLGGTA